MEAAPAGDGLEARVAAMEALDRAMEGWLQGIRDGGEPVAPTLPADASNQDWQGAAEAAVAARDKKTLPELTAAALKYWGREWVVSSVSGSLQLGTATTTGLVNAPAGADA